jgi:hypothetical protein
MNHEIVKFVEQLRSEYQLTKREKESIIDCLRREVCDPHPKTFRGRGESLSYNRVHRVCGALMLKRREKGLSLPVSELRRDVNHFLYDLRQQQYGQHALVGAKAGDS